MIRAGVVGATGYTGIELVKLLARHPDVSVVFATSQSSAGELLSDLHAAAPPLPLIAPNAAAYEAADIVFLCLPHAAAAPTALMALEAGARVIDLSADFRLRDAPTYEAWYGVPHPAPALLADAVYGLTEFARETLPAARLVANPGCYPTSILLGLKPLLAAGAAASGTIIADAKSGVSGAGRAPKQETHFVEVADNFSPYKIGRAHRHLPEMEQEMQRWNGTAPSLIFAPHLLPVPRGILATIYIPLRPGWSEDRLYDLYAENYADEPFVRVLRRGKLATLAHAVNSNRCALSVTVSGGTAIVTSAIDNLGKGAAGQAVQNMNVMFALEEPAGLEGWQGI